MKHSSSFLTAVISDILSNYLQFFFSSLPCPIPGRVLPLSLRREQCLSFSNLVAKFRG